MLATLDAADLGNDGKVVFQVSADKVFTFVDAKRSGEGRWAKHDVHLSKPLSEFLGPDIDKISFSVRLDIARGVVPRDELRRLRTFRDLGLVLQFIVGGDLVGDYVLKGLSEDWRRLDPKGVLTTAIADLSLEEYK